MDLGLGRVIEMFEERFGRKATTVLLAMVGLALFGVCADQIWQHIAIPTYKLFSELIGLPGWETEYLNLIPAIMSAATVSLLGGILIWAFGRLTLYRIRKDANQMEAELTALKLEAGALSAEAQENLRQSIERDAKVAAHLVESERLLGEIKALWEKLEDKHKDQ